MYGTAWKEERTADLTGRALAAGFRAIDTANQRRHYFEAAVGDAVAAASLEGTVARSDVFLQTKFTHRAGQDHRLPYDPAADIGVQVRQSFESSLEHLRTTYVDSLVLHGPSSRHGLAPGDWSAFRAMEDLALREKARLLGVSNVSLEQLGTLYEGAAIKPAFVQNRCFAVTGWDRDVRAFCHRSDIVYQGFSLLTANAGALSKPAIDRLVQRTGRSPAQLVFRFAIDSGMLPLTGTSNPVHMEEDLSCLDFELDPADVRAIEAIARS
jgi:diketogulonate reductase-like aldo/keto reductase